MGWVSIYSALKMTKKARFFNEKPGFREGTECLLYGQLLFQSLRAKGPRHISLGQRPK
jgi:hypothetical protein